MAEETKRIIEIEAKYETLADLQAEITKAKAALDDMTKGQIKALQETQGYQEADLATKRSLTKAVREQTKASADYQSGLTAVKALTTEYNAQMRLSAKEYSNADDGIKVVKGSYNDLVNQLARAKQAWKDAVPGTDAYEQATREVNRLKGELETMDHSIGNWQRNVGNYAGSISSIAGMFGSAGAAATGAVRGVAGLTTGFQALSATPVIGTLTILVSLLAKVSQSLKQSEAASMRMAEALAPLKAAGQLAKITFEGLANGLASVAEWLGKVADKLGLYTDRMRENQAITKESNALKRREREILIENSKLELEAAKARNIAADKARVSVQDRIKALETAEAAEKRILQNELEVAQKKFDLAKREAALSPNDTATNDALAQAEANLYRVQTSYEQGMRRIVSQHSAALQEIATADSAAGQAQGKLLTEQLALAEKASEEWLNIKKAEIEAEYNAGVASAKRQIRDAGKLNETLIALNEKRNTEILKAEQERDKQVISVTATRLRNEAQAYEEGTRDYLSRMVALRKYELDAVRRWEGQTEEEYNAARLNAEKEYNKAVVALKKKVADEGIEVLKLAYAESEQTTEQHLAYELALAEANLRNIETLGRQTGETETAYLTRVAEARKKVAEATEAVLDGQTQREALRMQNDMILLEEGSTARLAAEVELKQYELDTLHQLEGESDEEFRKRQLEAQKAYNEASKALTLKRVNDTLAMANAIASIMDSVAGAYQNEIKAQVQAGKISEQEGEKQFQNVKALQIAVSTIQMLTGITTALSGAFTTKTGPWDIALAAAQAATIAASGIANITKIANTTLGNTQTSSATGAGVQSAPTVQVAAPAVQVAVPEYRTLTSASDEQTLNERAASQKVVLVTSELEAHNAGRKVTLQESTF